MHDADDLLQDVALRAWANAHTFEITPDIKTEMRSWLCKITYRRWIDIRRMVGRETSLEEFDLEDSDVSEREDSKQSCPIEMIIEPVQDYRVWFGEVDQAFGRLAQIHQDALLTSGDYVGAGAARGVAEGTMKSRTNRARTRLLEMVS